MARFMLSDCFAAKQGEILMGKSTAVFGIYINSLQVDEAVDTLRMGGFRTTDISVLIPDHRGSRDLVHEKNSKAPEGAAAGISAGAAVGGALGLLAGIGALAIPGFGPFIAAGPIMGALAGAGAVGTLGGVAGALIGLGVPEYEARCYEGRMRNGGILISVHCDDASWIRRAKVILATTGANDIASTVEAAVGSARSELPKRRWQTL
jgi:hypothetical protein